MAKRYYKDDKEKRMKKSSRHRENKMHDMDSSGFYHPYETGGMIHNDYEAPANLPQQSFNKQYPNVGAHDHMWIDDTLSGIDEQIDGDGKGVTDYPLRGGRKY